MADDRLADEKPQDRRRGTISLYVDHNSRFSYITDVPIEDHISVALVDGNLDVLRKAKESGYRFRFSRKMPPSPEQIDGVCNALGMQRAQLESEP